LEREWGSVLFVFRFYRSGESPPERLPRETSCGLRLTRCFQSPHPTSCATEHSTSHARNHPSASQAGPRQIPRQRIHLHHRTAHPPDPPPTCPNRLPTRRSGCLPAITHRPHHVLPRILVRIAAIRWACASSTRPDLCAADGSADSPHWAIWVWRTTRRGSGYRRDDEERGRAW
jgi:hypothetical protein